MGREKRLVRTIHRRAQKEANVPEHLQWARGRLMTLLLRDGPRCFFCHRELDTTLTVEHLVPSGHGGPNKLSNLALAHRACNHAAGDLSVVEKVKMREEARWALHIEEIQKLWETRQSEPETNNG